MAVVIEKFPRIVLQLHTQGQDLSVLNRGWSVIMAGRASVGFVQPGAPAPEAWPVGAKAVQLTVEIDKVTGRRLRQP